MTKEELIIAIRVLTDYGGITLKEIEETLKMPRNYLSGMLNGTRPFAPKWQTLLIAYVQAKTGGNTSIVIPIEGAKVPVVTPPQKHKKPKPDPTAIRVAPSAKTPPAGLTKAQKIRWHRENNQPLQ